MKKVILITISLLFISVVALFILMLISGVRKINSTDYAAIYNQLADYLAKPKGKVEVVDAKDGQIIVRFIYNDNRPHRVLETRVPLKNNNNAKKIYVFGGSEVFTDKEAVKFLEYNFPSRLNNLLVRDYKDKFTVYNFGMAGVDSFDERDIISAILNVSRPDLIIYYDTSSTDYIKPYFMFLRKHFYFIWNYVLDKPRGPRKFHMWLSELVGWLDADLLSYAQEFKWIKLNSQAFDSYNDLIVSYYKKNTLDIINLARGNKIPLVVVTPITNLLMPPHGPNPESSDFYARAKKERDYLKKVNYLFEANDGDIFSFRIGRKKKVHEFLNSLKSPGIYVFNLEDELIRDKFNFDSTNFFDRLHMKKDAHKKIADKLYLFLKNNDVIN